MILKAPFSISSRLLPCLEVGGACIQLTYAKRPGREGRTRYESTIDLPEGGTFADDSQQSGCQGGSLQEGFSGLFDFLTAAAESYQFEGWQGENSLIFPKPVVEWASLNKEALDMLAMELSEDAGELIVE